MSNAAIWKRIACRYNYGFCRCKPDGSINAGFNRFYVAFLNGVIICPAFACIQEMVGGLTTLIRNVIRVLSRFVCRSITNISKLYDVIECITLLYNFMRHNLYKRNMLVRFYSSVLESLQ